MTFIPDAAQKPRRWRHTKKFPGHVNTLAFPRAPFFEETEEPKDEVIKYLKRIEKKLTRSHEDWTAAISDTQSTLFIDYRGKSHLYLFSATAITLNLYDIGTLAVPANTWTDISFREHTQIFTKGQATAVFVAVRATDDLIVANAPPLANPLPVSGPFTETRLELGTFTQTGGVDTSLLPITDVTGYARFSIDVTNISGAQLFINQSNTLVANPPTGMTNSLVERADGGITVPSAQPSITATGLFVGRLNGRYLQVNFHATGGGGSTATATIELMTEPFSPQLPAVQLLAADSFIGVVGLSTSSDRDQRVRVAAGLAADTLYDTTGAQHQTLLLRSVMINVTGTAALQIYDAGVTPIPTTNPRVDIPANQPVGPLQVNLLCDFGIGVAGNANNPAFTMCWTRGGNF